jgi:hypothetical protein
MKKNPGKSVVRSDCGGSDTAGATATINSGPTTAVDPYNVAPFGEAGLIALWASESKRERRSNERMHSHATK